MEKDLLAELRETALEAGLDLLGACSAEPVALRDEWRHHDQPRELLPGAQAVVVAGFCAVYEPRPVPSTPGVPRGRFTPFGSRVYEQMWNHGVTVVSDFLRERGYEAVEAPEVAIKPAVVRSGLGRYGKHGVVITPELGSMVMFSAIVTDAPLADATTDSPLYAEICPPDCRLCVDACPTAALPGNGTLRRERCITNWLWGAPAPFDIRAEQRNRLFGCAECLLACPVNAHVVPRTSHPVPTDTVDDGPELIPLAAGDEAYYDSAIPTFPRQAGRWAMRGNAIVALGNVGDPAAEVVLKETIRLDDARHRAYSAWALGRLRTTGAREALETARSAESDPEVLAEIEAALR